MRHQPCAIVLPLAIATACGAPELPPVYGSQPVDVSLIRVLADPGPFHGRIVRTVGLCSIQFEDVAVYLHREDYDQLILENAVWLNIGGISGERFEELRGELNGRYCLVEGRLSATAHGHLGVFAAEIRDITRLERSRSRTELAKALQSPAPPASAPGRRTTR